MSLVSLTFIFFFIGVLLVYYLLPGKEQWVVLLGSSLLFYFCMARPATFLYVIASAISVYLSSGQIEYWDKKIEKTEEKEQRQKLERAKKRAYLSGLVVCAGMLVVLKYTSFFLSNVRMFAGVFGKGEAIPAVQWIASLGISFYTLQMIGYLTDVYWGISKAQKKFARLLLFNCYFPQMVSGPISRYPEIGKTLFDVHKFDGRTVYLGFFRVLVGFFKKLVIAEHLSQITNIVFADPVQYGGIYVWIGTALYVIEIYADFSGSMDIVIGVSECFGIALAENFKIPFSSHTIQEFWQRWHITLGTWLKDYIMFPILRSGLWKRYAGKIKEKWGKRAAKLLPTFGGMLILWLAMGLWHGGGWNYIGEGVWFWLVIVLGQIFDPWLKQIMQKYRFHAEGRAWHAFCCFRTTFIFAVGILFFRSDSLGNAFYMLKEAFSVKAIIRTSKTLIPNIIAMDSTVGTMQLIWSALSISVGVATMTVWGIMEKRGLPFRSWLAKKNPVIQGLIVYILLLSMILLGAYGPGYSASEFIYGGF